uniref:Uncharacterized protein n=1 Tax=Glossina pallidipes TaxID=7398 RepID=A0A1B0AGB8_GLOPL
MQKCRNVSPAWMDIELLEETKEAEKKSNCRSNLIAFSHADPTKTRIRNEGRPEEPIDASSMNKKHFVNSFGIMYMLYYSITCYTIVYVILHGERSKVSHQSDIANWARNLALNKAIRIS